MPMVLKWNIHQAHINMTFSVHILLLNFFTFYALDVSFLRITTTKLE